MAYPPAYSRAYSFTDYEVNFPGQPKPGDKLDAEFDAVSNALDGTQNALALIQRADGQLANASVGVDQLQTGLFDGIADGITDDAQAAADAAAASASAAATSSSQAQTSATNAAASAGTASGAAAQAGVSQGIAQSSANDASLSASNAFDNAQIAANASNEAQGFRNEGEGFQNTAFNWAELLTGPVLPAPPGWPEAVDDGMFSSKWWAIRARDYNSTSTIDLGTVGSDVGDAFTIWAAIPGNELGIGQTYATWGSPVQTYVLLDRDHPEDPDSWLNITGGPGPPNILTIGTVQTTAPGTPATASITGTSPAQVLNLSMPQGPQGVQGVIGPVGPAGPANSLAVGSTTTGAPGSAASVTITGASPAQTINFTIPRGDQGIQGIQGIQGPPGTISFPILAPDGTILAPVYSFAADTDTGLFRFGADTMAITCGGIETLRASNGRVWTGDGSATFPSKSFIADTGTGFFRAAAQSIGVSLAGTRAFAFYANVSLPTAIGDNVVFSSSAGSPNAGSLLFGDGSGWTFNIGTRVGGVNIPTIMITDLGRTLFGAGTSGNPSIAFIADPDTGFFRTSSDFMSAAAGGVELQRWYGPGQTALSRSYFPATVSLANGTTAQPSLCFEAAIGAGLSCIPGSYMVFSFAAAPKLYIGTVWIQSEVPLLAPDGGPSLPGFAFAQDQDTGMYRYTTNALAFACGGSRILYLGQTSIEASAVVLGVDGGVTTPSFSFQADTDTGIYRGGNNEINFTTGGVDRGKISSFGSTHAYMQMNRAALATGEVGFAIDGGAGSFRWFMYMPTNDSTLAFNGNGAIRMTLSPVGAVTAASFTSTSSRAIKRETGVPKRAASILSRLRPILYRLLDGGESEQLGLIAEEVQDVCPQLSDGKSVAYDRLALLLLAAWQDEHAEAA